MKSALKIIAGVQKWVLIGLLMVDSRDHSSKLLSFSENCVFMYSF